MHAYILYLLQTDMYMYIHFYPLLKCMHTIDQENFVVNKVMWDKTLTHFNFVKAESIVCTYEYKRTTLLKKFSEF